MTSAGARTALVTGGSSGIGSAVVRALVEDGLTVEFCGRDAARISAVAAAHKAAATDRGTDVIGTVCDVTDETAVGAYVDAVTARHGRIDVLVNCAGRSGGGALDTLSTQAWNDVLQANLQSVFYVTRAVLARGGIRESDHGRIVNIASTAGKQGIALATPYCASKHAVVGFTKALGLELAKTTVTVNAVCPGYVDTPLAERVLDAYGQAWGVSPEVVRERFNAKIPKGRYGTPEEVAGLVSYLVSPGTAIITAQAINVCGGLGNF